MFRLRSYAFFRPRPISIPSIVGRFPDSGRQVSAAYFVPWVARSLGFGLGFYAPGRLGPYSPFFLGKSFDLER